MVIFNSYVKLPEGTPKNPKKRGFIRPAAVRRPSRRRQGSGKSTDVAQAELRRGEDRHLAM